MKVIIKGKKVEAKLPKPFKIKWVKALRSENYLQTEERLYNPFANDGKGGYCCLGVACAIQHPKLNLTGGWITDEIAKKTRKVPSILKGLDGNNELVKKLTKMNDSGKWSFNRIATYIEKYL